MSLWSTKPPKHQKEGVSRAFIIKASLFLGLLSVGVGIAIYLKLDSPSTEHSDKTLPVIRAPSGPLKVPYQGNSSSNPSQNYQIYQRMEGKTETTQPQVEQLLPPVEAPMLHDESSKAFADGPFNDSTKPQDQKPPALEPQENKTQPEEKAPKAPPSPPPVKVAEKPKINPSLKSSPSIDQLLNQRVKAKATSPKTFQLQIGPFLSKQKALDAWKKIQTYRFTNLKSLSANIKVTSLGKGKRCYHLIIPGFPTLVKAKLAANQLLQKKVNAIALPTL